MAPAPETSQDVTDPEVIIAFWRLETASELLLEFATREGVSVADSVRAFQARSTLDGHLLAARLLLSSGGSEPSVAGLLRRAAGVVTPLSDLLNAEPGERT